ncbi:MAG: DNA-3-methyladenine glycosylase 2 family protein [Nocardioidaceae bacterium]|nr:DNA-3-methyladenine glycosylase 2 family protein [Nocardioidaceae bacterium]
MTPLTRTWRPDWPCPVGAVLGVHRRGAGDPTYRIVADGRHRRAFRTPEGPVSLEVGPLDSNGEVHARAWGEGADWALDTLPRLLGADDDPAGFVPPPQLAASWRRLQHWRLGGSGLVWESLAPTIIEQKVTGKEAFGAFRQLVRRFGERAPGPDGLDLMLQPTPEQVRAIPSWEWLKLPVDGGRSRPLVGAARVADALQRAADAGVEEFDRSVRTLPGIGVWTSAEVRASALGDADAVSFGDYHLGKDVGWALVGEAVDDDAVAELLEPYRPHRHRVQQLVAAGGHGRPRRGPRMAPRTHLPAR